MERKKRMQRLRSFIRANNMILTISAIKGRRKVGHAGGRNVRPEDVTNSRILQKQTPIDCKFDHINEVMMKIM